jgi:Flp pilus assembly protein TadG
MIEAAFLFPVLFVIAFGTMDFSRLFYTGTAVVSAAQAGARFGIQTPSASSDLAGMQTAATNDFGAGGMTATATQSCKCQDGSTLASCSDTCTVGKKLIYVQVITRATFRPLGYYPYIPTSIPVSAKAVMRAQ